jgi:hypothetical protein
MRNRILAGFGLLAIVSAITLVSVPAVRAQVLPGAKARMLEPLPPSIGYEKVSVGPLVGPVNAGVYQVVNCPPGKKIVGGGVTIGSGSMHWNASGPQGDAWMVSGRTESSTPASNIWVTAICIAVP